MSQIPQQIETIHEPQVMPTKIVPGINAACSSGK